VTEALRYLDNAREILKSIPVEDNTYIDIKLVRKACKMAYLAVLKATDGYLIRNGVTKKKLPRSFDDYIQVLGKFNRKLMRRFETLYKELYIAGYYSGLIYDVDMVKNVLKAAKSFIEELSKDTTKPHPCHHQHCSGDP